MSDIQAVTVLVTTELLAELGEWSQPVQVMIRETPGSGTGWELIARHEQRLEHATYTAAEVKVLTEAALRLGRREAGEEIAERIEALAGTPTMRGSMAGEMLLSCAKTARELSSQPSAAVSDERSGEDESPGVTCSDCGLTDDHKGGCLQTGEAPRPGAPG